jgi:PAS domain S-box-containing protein
VLIRYLSDQVSESLRAGGAAVIIARPAHRQELTRRLDENGLDMATAERAGRYVCLDAADTLERLMAYGLAEERFRELMRQTLDRARAATGAESPDIFLFGEMVALLWERGQSDAALRLEELWNRLAQENSFRLHCSYPMACFTGEDDDAIRKICELHTARVEEFSHPETQSELRHDEQRLRQLVEKQQDYAIFLLDADGYVTSWNDGAQRIKGYEASEIIGRHFSCFYSEEDIRAGKPQNELEIAAGTGRLEDEGWRVRKDGSTFWANVIITALRDKNGGLCGYGKVTRDLTQQMQAQEMLRSSNERLSREIGERMIAESKLRESERSLRLLSRHLLQIRDEERKHIGRELHDSIGQYLAALKMGLDAVSAERDAQGHGHSQLSESVLLVDRCISQIRAMSYSLYPPLLEEMGLKMAVPWYLDGFARRTGIQTKLEMSHEFCRLSKEVELTLFRVLQETLTNVQRHSGSPEARVRVFVENESATLEVEDKGRGTNTTVLEPGSAVSGSGLQEMNERVRQLGGQLVLSSGPCGTTVRASIPSTSEASI